MIRHAIQRIMDISICFVEVYAYWQNLLIERVVALAGEQDKELRSLKLIRLREKRVSADSVLTEMKHQFKQQHSFIVTILQQLAQQKRFPYRKYTTN
jgi:hypothetical protein